MIILAALMRAQLQTRVAMHAVFALSLLFAASALARDLDGKYAQGDPEMHKRFE